MTSLHANSVYHISAFWNQLLSTVFNISSPFVSTITHVLCMILYYNMTARIFGAKLWWLPLTAGCVKRQLPASSSRVRHNGQRVPPAVLAPVSIRFIMIMLKPATYTSTKQYLICLWWLMIPHKLFWWWQITLPALTGHTILRAWRRSSRTSILHGRDV